MTAQQVAARFGCTIEQAKAQFAANAAQLEKLAEKARATAKNVRGFTAAQLAEHAADFRARAA